MPSSPTKTALEFLTPAAAAAPAMEKPRESWGTTRRLQNHISHLDQSGIEEMIDRVMKMGGAKQFITKFHPQPTWLWRQWHGTVLEHTWSPALLSLTLACLLVHSMERIRLDGDHKWTFFEVPHPDDVVVSKLKGFTTMWGYLLTMATFTNSFFLSQAYGFWLATKGNVRKVQGRLSDLGMLIAVHAQRDGDTGKFTPESQHLIDEVARYTRLYHMLFWAGQVRPARGDAGVSISVLRTEVGLTALLERKALNEREHELLVENPRLSETQRHFAVLEWILARFVDARRTGVLGGGVGLETRFLEEACKLRAVCASITDDAAARMPLSYVHLVQLLVDCLVFLAPFALYPKLGPLSIPLSGILVVFYRGFLQLSKSFLDPFGNEDSTSENLSIDCLVCETNASSVRWGGAIDELPFPTSNVVSESERQTPEGRTKFKLNT